MKGRFAPTPSGRMHLGNLFSALLAWLDARSQGGRMVLRLEDLDPDRCTQAWCDQVMRDLEWLGLDWDEGGVEPNYCQSRRSQHYEAAFRTLEEQGLVYPCYCSRAQRLAASAPPPGGERDLGHCPCRDLSQAEREAKAMVKAPAWKVALPHETVQFRDLIQGEQAFDLARDCGDFVIRRADGVYGYQLAVTVDDALMGVTRVVRGRDLLDSAARQIWLMEQLGYHAPVYAHVPLLLAPDGRRLSKRERDLDMGALRERFSPGSLRQLLWDLLALPDHGAEGQDFSIDKVGKEDISIEIME